MSDFKKKSFFYELNLHYDVKGRFILYRRANQEKRCFSAPCNLKKVLTSRSGQPWR